MPNKYTRLIIHAVNISQGGGGSLLKALLNDVPNNFEVLALLDRRMEFSTAIPAGLRVIFIRPTIFHRAFAEWWLFKNVTHGDKVLCFGSLPPLFKLRGNTSVFIQNRYLIERIKLVGFNLKTKFRLYFERFRLKFSASHADEFIVQSTSMKDALAAQPWVGKLTPIHIKPFILKSESHQSKSMSTQGGIKSIKKNYDFIYVATGEPHKNHPTLIEAWCLLAEQNLFPSLCLTLDQKISKQLCKLIESKQKAYGINVFNSGANTHDQIMSLYSQTRALIFPSILESFGLPLIEARDAGLPILASELDYVRDSIDPVQTFDPFSAQSIARAVKRFIEVEEKRICIIDGTQFLASLLGDR